MESVHGRLPEFSQNIKETKKVQLNDRHKDDNNNLIVVVIAVHTPSN
jgi:hypothetical protein